MDPIAPVAGSVGDNAEPTKTTTTTARAGDPPASRPQQSAATALPATAAAASPAKAPPRQSDFSASTTTATSSPNGNDRVTRERPPQQSLHSLQQQQNNGSPQRQQQQQHQRSLQMQQHQHARQATTAASLPRHLLQQQQHQQQQRHGSNNNNNNNSRIPTGQTYGHQYTPRASMSQQQPQRQHYQQQQQNYPRQQHQQQQQRQQQRNIPIPRTNVVHNTGSVAARSQFPPSQHHHRPVTVPYQQQQQQLTKKAPPSDAASVARLPTAAAAAPKAAPPLTHVARIPAAASTVLPPVQVPARAMTRGVSAAHQGPPQQQHHQQQKARVHYTQQQHQHHSQSMEHSLSETDPPPLPPTPEQSQRTLQEEQIAQQRSGLVDKYAPFVAPCDRSLKEARQRLKAALEQTRQLRIAFTERVYGKYRVCLVPPETSEEIIANVHANPKAVSRRLDLEIRQIKDEKELEKKEAQSLNAEFSKVDSSMLSVSADNAEQLMYLSAGLSLVILPEDPKVDPKLVEGYQDRGPLNIATGQRVRSISQAAAAAGEVILERSRKGAALRKQWQAHGKVPHGAPGKFTNPNDRVVLNPHQQQTQQQQYSPMDLLTAPTNPQPPTAAVAAVKPNPPASNPIPAAAVAVVPVAVVKKPAALKPPPVVAPVVVAKQSTAPLQAASAPATASMPPPQNQEPAKLIRRPSKMPTILSSAASSSKFGKSRGGAGISVNISLSLNPTADELSLDPEKSCRASTAALMARGLGTAQGISRASPQQRLRHPHPESMGGRQRASSATSAKKELATLTQNAAAMSGSSHQNRGGYVHSYLNLALPPLPTPMERRDRKCLKVLDESRAASNARAKRAIRSVLDNLKDSKAAPSDGNPASHATRIGLLRDVQKSRTADVRAGEASPAERRIDPSLTFSVLQAIGLITEAGSEDIETSPGQMDAKVERLKAGSKRKLSSLDSLQPKWDQISLSKKPKFSDKVILNRKGDREPAPGARSTVAAAPVESIRGGGEMIPGSTDESSGQGVPLPQGLSEADARKADAHAQARNATFGNQANNGQREGLQQQAQCGDPSRQSLGMMNQHHGVNGVSMGTGNVQGNAAAAHHHQGQPNGGNNDVYHQQGNFNALHLAQQLRHASSAMTGMATHPDQQPPVGMQQVANFMGGGQYQAAPWSPNGTSAAAMVAAQSSLAAMGLQFPMGAYNAVQDRAARALLAREQQNVAAAHAVAAHQQSLSQSAFLGGAANPGFAPTSCAMPRYQQHAGFLNAAPQYNTGAPSSVVTPSPAATLQHQSQLRNSQQNARAAAMQARNQEQKRAQPNPARAGLPSSTTVKRKAADLGTNQAIASSKPAATIPINNNHGAAAKKQKQASDSKAANQQASSTEKPSAAEAASKQAGPVVAKLVADNGALFSSGSNKSGLRFFLPKVVSVLLSPDEARLAQTGQVHSLLDIKTSVAADAKTSEVLAYLLALGANVPIPKAFVASFLKERLNIPGFKHLTSSVGFNIPREIVAAVILVWLWNYHEDDFQQAFAKSGRIDVDPTCKWLVQAAVDASVKALTAYIRESGMIASARNAKSDAATKPTPAERTLETPPNLEAISASVVSTALTSVSRMSNEVDCVLPQFHQLAQFLDECRTVALQSRSQERVLLANLLSLKSVMSESFAHAYASSMVRAGDALGHDDLAETVMDDDRKITSLLPFDILKDEVGAWEDPCRPEQGFTPNLTGDVLTKVAHARAMIQKSMRRLQDRHNIKAGTPTSGAYTDMLGGSSGGGSASANAGNKTPTGGSTPKSWSRRKGATSSEGPISSGTGSANATSWALYDPKHFSAPLQWNPTLSSNSPYGRYQGQRPRSMSSSGGGQKQGCKAGTALSVDVNSDLTSKVVRGTNEIDWSTVAHSFNSVKLKGATSPHAAKAAAARTHQRSFSKTIISPFCRELSASPVASDDESDTEEDLSDETVLAKHQFVLDEMKEKLTAFMERKKQKNKEKNS